MVHVRGVAWLLAIVALFSAWIPWAGPGLAAAALLLSLLPPRDALRLAAACLALLLGAMGTAAFHLLPKGSLQPDDRRLELLEERFQPVGNLEEKSSSP